MGRFAGSLLRQMDGNRLTGGFFGQEDAMSLIGSRRIGNQMVIIGRGALIRLYDVGNLVSPNEAPCGPGPGMLGAALINVLPEPLKLLAEHGDQMLRREHSSDSFSHRLRHNGLLSQE